MELTRNVDEFGAGVYLNEVALSNREGTLILNHAGGTDQSASLHKRDLGYAGVNLHPQGTAVPVSRLIDHLPERSVVDLLKIDAEGHELFVMLGAGEKLIPSRVTNIQWEINSCALDSRTFFKDFWTMLTERGYSISQINSEGVVQPPIARYDPSLEDFAAHREFLASPA
jgi:FkbM family methyltransferase